MRTQQLKPLVMALAMVFTTGSVWAVEDNSTVTPEVELPAVKVTGVKSVSVAVKKQLPVTTESVTKNKLEETVNVVNTEDSVKYLPSVMVRKRHIGDTYAPITTRTSGPGQSARSLIYADGVLLSALIGNNNGSASPRWSMVAPEEIERIDILYGPFSAAYAGNSVGAVVEMTTRMPEKFEASIKALAAQQNSSVYGTSGNSTSKQLSATLGNRTGDFSWWLSANQLDSNTQPISFAVATKAANQATAVTANLIGGYADVSKLGAPIAVVGAGGIEHKLQDNLKVKLAYDFTPTVSGAYSIGLFTNNVKSDMQSYLTTTAGAPSYPGASTIAIGGTKYTVAATALSAGVYTFNEEHLMQSLALKSNTQSTWDWEAVASVYDFTKDNQRAPGSIAAAQSGTGAGTNVSMDGTGWNTLDLKGIWRPDGVGGKHQLSFGVHNDQEKMVTTKYNITTSWLTGANGAVATDSRGKTKTDALWLQDVWRVASDYKLTLGGRYEKWNAFDGINYSLTPALNVLQPGISATKFSPKASLAWVASDQWVVTGSVGVANRFPTVAELYQAVATGATLTSPNPNLRPEHALSGELALVRSEEKSKLRVSFFQENLSDALISQSSTLPGTATIATAVQNVEKVRTLGLEIVGQKDDVLIKRLELSGSVTYVDSKIISDPAFRNAAGVLTNVAGMRTPNIPTLRGTVVATYRPDDKLALTVAGRYSSRLYTTMDNSDPVTSTYTGFDPYFVVDIRANYKIDKQWNASVGIDNVNNRKYWLYHPFPQRTLMAEAKFKY